MTVVKAPSVRRHRAARLCAVVAQILVLGGLICTPASLVLAGVNAWTSHGPSDGDVQVLAVSPTTPSTLYAGDPNTGVFKSTDGGNSWTASNTGLPGVSTLAIDPTTPSTLYVGTPSTGVFKSTDGGGSWSASLDSHVRGLT